MNLGRTQAKLSLLLLSLVLVTFFTLSRKTESKIVHRKVSSSDFEKFSSEFRKNNVFLVDTGIDSGRVKFTSRLACAIESAARANVDRKIILFYASLERLKAIKYSPLIDAILTYPNVFLDSVNVTKLSIGSPMENFFKTNQLAKSKFPVEHLSDAMRLLILWKYGGAYIDGDMIVRRSFDSVPSNFVCRQEMDFNNGVMAFNHEKDGINLLETMMKEFAEKYNPNVYAENGSDLVTRVIKRLCGKDNIDQIMSMKSCKGLTFLKVLDCYAIRKSEWQKFVSNDRAVAIEVMTRVQESLVVHIWGHSSKNSILETDSVAAYLELARQFCPRVFQASGEYF